MTKPNRGGTLSLLELQGVGPARKLRFEPAERVNLITGDNGLGKTFLLECAWWALCGNWTGYSVYPRQDADRDEPRITCQILGKSGESNKFSSFYDWVELDWFVKPFEIHGLLVYARVDGAFAVSDPTKNLWGYNRFAPSGIPSPLVLTREEVWEGLYIEVKGSPRFLSNGLIRDWVDWQNTPGISPFNTLKKVLRRLSPPDLDRGDLGPLEPGAPVRIPGDSRLMPTIKHSYGEVPLIYASAGVRRIVALAYLIVWAYAEHKAQAELAREEPCRRMVILIDEIEAHLHPQWQRVILPALLDIQEDLEAELQIQFLITTHSPLVMASMEPRFDAERDKVFHLDLIRQVREADSRNGAALSPDSVGGTLGGEVALEELDFVRHGPVDSWLMSEVFEMRHARSLEAEQAIEDAKKLQMQDKVTTEEVRDVTERLVKYLAGDDKFWPRWTFFAEQHGVEL